MIPKGQQLAKRIDSPSLLAYNIPEFSYLLRFAFRFISPINRQQIDDCWHDVRKLQARK